MAIDPNAVARRRTRPALTGAAVPGTQPATGFASILSDFLPFSASTIVDPKNPDAGAFSLTGADTGGAGPGLSASNAAQEASHSAQSMTVAGQMSPDTAATVGNIGTALSLFGGPPGAGIAAGRTAGGGPTPGAFSQAMDAFSGVPGKIAGQLLGFLNIPTPLSAVLGGIGQGLTSSARLAQQLQGLLSTLNPEISIEDIEMATLGFSPTAVEADMALAGRMFGGRTGGVSPQMGPPGAGRGPAGAGLGPFEDPTNVAFGRRPTASDPDAPPSDPNDDVGLEAETGMGLAGPPESDGKTVGFGELGAPGGPGPDGGGPATGPGATGSTDPGTGAPAGIGEAGGTTGVSDSGGGSPGGAPGDSGPGSVGGDSWHIGGYVRGPNPRVSGEDVPGQTLQEGETVVPRGGFMGMPGIPGAEKAHRVKRLIIEFANDKKQS